MITAVKPYSVQNNKKQNFGSFPVPKHRGEAQSLLDKVGFGEIKKTPDNIESLKTAFKQGQAISGGDWISVRNRLNDIAETWGLNPTDLTK